MVMVANREKKELREKLLKRLLSLTLAEIERRSNNVEKKLSSLPIYRDAKVIMAYYPLKGEVNILEMIRKDIGSKRFCFPVMDLKAKNLRIFEISQLDKDFISGPFGVKEPDTAKTREVDISKIDMVIVPALAFDHKLNRLGRGAGYYDRFLQKISPLTKKVGIAFEFQVLDNLPNNPLLDQKVDIVVSENFII
jgi:5-formyltetrahydrofolate cyclo-ligase